jgi:hypothetical protein
MAMEQHVMDAIREGEDDSVVNKLKVQHEEAEGWG